MCPLDIGCTYPIRAEVEQRSLGIQLVVASPVSQSKLLGIHHEQQSLYGSKTQRFAGWPSRGISARSVAKTAEHDFSNSPHSVQQYLLAPRRVPAQILQDLPAEARQLPNETPLRCIPQSDPMQRRSERLRIADDAHQGPYSDLRFPESASLRLSATAGTSAVTRENLPTRLLLRRDCSSQTKVTGAARSKDDPREKMRSAANQAVPAHDGIVLSARRTVW